jgi:site-specific DNA recombinase
MENILATLRKRNQGRPLTAALYARYSSDAQNDGNSIEAQVNAITDYAQRENIVIVGQYKDMAKSGTTADRPEFQRMMRDAEQKRFKIVLIHKYDRFMRDEYEGIMHERILSRYGISLISVAEPINSDEPIVGVTKSIMRSFAAYYSKNLSKEVMKGMVINARNAYSTGGRPPLGYDTVPVKTSDGKHRMRYVINEKEAEAVRLMFRMVLDGHGYSEIIKQLNAAGYKTKAGRSFGKSSVHDILVNRKYKGEFIFNRSIGKDPLTKQRNHHQSKPEEEWVIVQNGIPAIISEADFNRVQELLHVRKHVRRPQYVETYLLTGKIFCGVCGHAYQGNRNATHKDRPPYITYRCGNRASRHQTSGCKNKPINRDAVESFVLDKLSMNIFNPDIVDIIMDRFKEYANQQNTDSQGLIRQYKRSLQAYQRQEANLLQSVTETENAEVRKVLLVQLEKLSEKKSQTEQLLKNINCSDKELPTKAVLKELLQQARRQFRKGTLQETKKLIDVFVDRVTIGIGEVELKLYLMPPVTDQNIPDKLCQEIITIDRNTLKNNRNKVS